MEDSPHNDDRLGLGGLGTLGSRWGDRVNWSRGLRSGGGWGRGRGAGVRGLGHMSHLLCGKSSLWGIFCGEFSVANLPCGESSGNQKTCERTKKIDI